MVLGVPSLSIIIELCPGLIVAIFHCPRGRARHNDRLCSAAEQAQTSNVKARDIRVLRKQRMAGERYIKEVINKSVKVLLYILQCSKGVK